MDIATLEAKKTVLVAQRDQLMANFNASLGAIAMCDELLGELYRAAETQKQLDAVAKEMAAEAEHNASKVRAPVEVMQDGLAVDHAAEVLAAAPFDFPPASAPEMLPVIQPRAEPCSHVDCEFPQCDCDGPQDCVAYVAPVSDPA